MAKRKYTTVDDTKVKGDIDSHRGSGKFFKLKEGANYVRILPPVEGLVTPGTYYGLHHQHGFKIEGGFRAIRCLHDKGLWCPVCSMADHFRKLDDDDNKKRARACFSDARYFLNVISGTLNKVEKEITANEEIGVALLQVSNSLFQKCNEHRTGEWGDFTDPKEGYWLNIHGEGEGTSRRYPSVTPSRRGMGPLPEWVEEEEWHDCTSDALVPVKKTSEVVMMLVDRYSDICEVEQILRKAKVLYEKRRGEGKRATPGA